MKRLEHRFIEGPVDRVKESMMDQKPEGGTH